MRDPAVRTNLIFDLDGTLVDSCAICVDILRGMLADRNSDHVIDPHYARPFMSRGGQIMVAALLGPACDDPASDLAEFRGRYAKMQTPLTALFPGVTDGLKRLHGMGFTLSICSNKPQNLCEQVIRDTGLTELFSVVVGCQPNLRPKPETDLMEHALERLGVSASDCVYVGDSELDEHVASALGIPFKFLTYGYATDGWYPQSSDCFDNFPTLAESLLHYKPLEAVAGVD
ncbi:MAG: hypothetical protein RLZZ84_1961 [Pseudomonadota bacterium]